MSHPAPKYRVCARCGFEQWTDYRECHRCAARTFGRTAREEQRIVAACVTIAVASGTLACIALLPLLMPGMGDGFSWPGLVGGFVVTVAFGSLGRQLGGSIARRRSREVQSA